MLIFILFLGNSADSEMFSCRVAFIQLDNLQVIFIT